jgi:hypothetical protein
MTKKEFEAQQWRKGMKCIIDEDSYPIASVNFSAESITIRHKNNYLYTYSRELVTIKND